jgi:hypothetical protein
MMSIVGKTVPKSVYSQFGTYPKEIIDVLEETYGISPEQLPELALGKGPKGLTFESHLTSEMGRTATSTSSIQRYTDLGRLGMAVCVEDRKDKSIKAVIGVYQAYAVGWKSNPRTDGTSEWNHTKDPNLIATYQKKWQKKSSSQNNPPYMIPYVGTLSWFEGILKGTDPLLKLARPIRDREGNLASNMTAPFGQYPKALKLVLEKNGFPSPEQLPELKLIYKAEEEHFVINLASNMKEELPHASMGRFTDQERPGLAVSLKGRKTTIQVIVAIYQLYKKDSNFNPRKDGTSEWQHSTSLESAKTLEEAYRNHHTESGHQKPYDKCVCSHYEKGKTLSWLKGILSNKDPVLELNDERERGASLVAPPSIVESAGPEKVPEPSPAIPAKAVSPVAAPATDQRSIFQKLTARLASAWRSFCVMFRGFFRRFLCLST